MHLFILQYLIHIKQATLKFHWLDWPLLQGFIKPISYVLYKLIKLKSEGGELQQVKGGDKLA